VPLTWAELERTDPKQFAVANFDKWKARLKRDPWLRMNDVKQQLSDRAIAAVTEMAGKKST
jgi:DNA primase